VTDDRLPLLARIDRAIAAVESATLVLLLTLIIVLASGQIVLRLVFDTGFIWADELLRLLVFWLALVGAVAASRSDRHIRVDLLTHILADRYVALSRLVVNGFAAGICGLLAWHAMRFLHMTYEGGDTIFLDFPAWVAQSILPVALVLMGIRFLISSIAEGLTAIAASQEDEPS